MTISVNSRFIDEQERAQNLAATLFRRAQEANAALLRGDIRAWLALIRLSHDFSLMDPFGGPPSHGFDPSDAHVEALARFFRGGAGQLELVQSYATGDMVVLAFIEHQHAAIATLPDQDWSLRVTSVYRREGTEWRLVHRHADPLVKGLSLEQAAALARGSLFAKELA